MNLQHHDGHVSITITEAQYEQLRQHLSFTLEEHKDALAKQMDSPHMLKFVIRNCLGFGNGLDFAKDFAGYTSGPTYCVP